jgi:hypothetical protein
MMPWREGEVPVVSVAWTVHVTAGNGGVSAETVFPASHLPSAVSVGTWFSSGLLIAGMSITQIRLAIGAPSAVHVLSPNCR